MKCSCFTIRLWLAAAVTGVVLSTSLRAATGELGLQAQLIWGTDGEKPKEPNLKDVDSATQDKLKKVFKWKNYYEVDKQEFKVPMSSKKRVRMSAKCEVEVENLGDSQVEVKLFGEGKMVVKKRQALKSGELLVLAGDDKNNTAWFVILTLSKR
jgi:hypothetical protein